MSLPHRIAGDIALDLVNTVSWRGTDHETDHLMSAEDIVTWAREADLVDHDFDLAAGESEILFKRILALRSAIGEAGAAIAHGKDVPTYALNAIRDLAAEALQAAEVRGVPATLKFTGVNKIVGAIAWSALDLFRGDELSRLKQCPPDDCHWLFIDRTKNGSRRWCDMATCGNRAKKQTYRKR
jgi:predicted RNA-binding Zn ribbon-like protein